MKAATPLLAALLVGCSAPAVSSPTCSAWDWIDRSRLTTLWEGWDGDIADVWRRWDQSQPGKPWPMLSGSAPQVRVSLQPYPWERQEAYEVIGAEGASGWTFWRRTTVVNTSTPSGGGVIETSAGWQPFALTTEGRRRFEGLLADDCLWAAPPFISDVVPLRAGGVDRNFDDSILMFDYRGRDRAIGGMYGIVAGAPGDLALLLVKEAFPDQPMNALHPAGPVNREPAG